jgi:hypothetical protein
MSVHVNAVNGALAKRGIFVVSMCKRPRSEGCVIFLPDVAHADTSAAIVRILVVVWVEASGQHGSIYAVQPGVTAAVGSMHLASRFVAQAAAASDETLLQVVASHSNLAAAIALAQPVHFASVAVLTTFQNRQPFKPLASQVHQFH